MQSVGLFAVNAPRLRKDWDSLESSDGRITADELLWLVIITMAVAGLRDRVLNSGDLLEYTLHYFVIWSVYSSAICYSGRFNDYDRVHGELWALFLLALLFMVAALYHSTGGFGICAGCAHFLLALAYARVALKLKRARYFASFFALVELGNALLLSCLLFRRHHIVLWLNLLYEPFWHGTFKLLVFCADIKWGEDQGKRILDVPGDFVYINARYESSHMMILVCSFLFPLALQGNAFLDSRKAALCIILGFCYALMAKLCFFDSKEHDAGIPLSIRGCKRAHWIHPLRRSRLSSRLFLMAFPLSVLGFAITGVGFIAAIQAIVENNESQRLLVRRALVLGPCLTWMILFSTMALGGPLDLFFMDRRTPCKLLLSALFLCNLTLRDPVSICILTVSIQSLILVFHVWLGRKFFREQNARNQNSEYRALVVPPEEPGSEDQDIPFYASWHRPRLLKDWSRIDLSLGDHVSSHEHFFTVLVAGACWILNFNLQEDRELSLYITQFLFVWAGLSMSMRYAARFNDDDGAHAVVWSIYQLLLLFLLEGLSASSSYTSFSLGKLFQIAATTHFAWLALGFWFRVAAFLPRARAFALTMTAICFIYSALATIAGFQTVRTLILVVFCGLVLFTDALLALGMRLTFFSIEKMHTFDLPVNVDYVIARYGGLQMEVLGVAVIVPNAYWPSAYPHPQLVAFGVGCAGLIAIFIKILLFDADATAPERHAVRQSQARAVVFFTLSPLTLLSISLMGGATSTLLPRSGSAAGAYRSQILLAASALFFASLTATKLSHAAQHLPAHRLKAVLTTAGFLATLAPVVFLDLSDSRITGLVPVVWTTLICLLVSFAQLGVNAIYFDGPACCPAAPPPRADDRHTLNYMNGNNNSGVIQGE